MAWVEGSGEAGESAEVERFEEEQNQTVPVLLAVLVEAGRHRLRAQVLPRSPIRPSGQRLSCSELAGQGLHVRDASEAPVAGRADLQALVFLLF